MDRLLILGGTEEARRLAAAANDRFEVIVSLAGRTRDPSPMAGRLRVGGFGGARGLAAFLAEERIDRVVDATHPFAARISAHAYDACLGLGLPRLQLARPPWPPLGADTWLSVADLAAAAEVLPRIGRTALLTVGRQELAAFALVPKVRFVVRLIEPPAEPLPLPEAVVVIGRPPFTLAGERALLSAHGIDVLVAKNSGGTATVAKLQAAHAARIKIVMIERPPPEPGPVAETVEQAVAWLDGI